MGAIDGGLDQIPGVVPVKRDAELIVKSDEHKDCSEPCHQDIHRSIATDVSCSSRLPPFSTSHCCSCNRTEWFPERAIPTSRRTRPSRANRSRSRSLRLSRWRQITQIQACRRSEYLTSAPISSDLMILTHLRLPPQRLPTITGR